jgi:hypothetical protein
MFGQVQETRVRMEIRDDPKTQDIPAQVQYLPKRMPEFHVDVVLIAQNT